MDTLEEAGNGERQQLQSNTATTNPSSPLTDPTTGPTPQGQEEVRTPLLHRIDQDLIRAVLSRLVVPSECLPSPTRPRSNQQGICSSGLLDTEQSNSNEVSSASVPFSPVQEGKEKASESPKRHKKRTPVKRENSTEKEKGTQGTSNMDISDLIQVSHSLSNLVVSDDVDMEMDEDKTESPLPEFKAPFPVKIGTKAEGSFLSCVAGPSTTTRSGKKERNGSNGIPIPVPTATDIGKIGMTSPNGVGGYMTIPPPPPPVYCANKKGGCEELGLPQFNCARCHHEFYCSQQHMRDNMIRHKEDCKTNSSLEVMIQDEEYMMWHKYAAPFLYDICLNFVLVWPSLTAQWLPEAEEFGNSEWMRHQLLLGTQTNGEQNHLIIAGVDVPIKIDNQENEDLLPRHKGTMHVLKRINHQGEVHRARYMPQNSNIVATKSPSADVFIFHCDAYSELPEDDRFQPTLTLKGHSKEGFGLSWNPIVSGRLISGSSDNLVCLWDINSQVGEGGSIHPLSTLSQHTATVEDVAWHVSSSNICASGGDDKKLVIWDCRSNSINICAHSVDTAHDGDINALAFSPFSEFLLATASSDQTVGIWDLRNMKIKLRSLDFHKDEVMQVEWSPSSECILASTGKDHKVFMWNLKALDKRGSDVVMEGGEEDDEAPRELMFIHGGHVAPVSDISWNGHEMGMIASVSEDNILQVWKISDDLVSQGTDGEDQDDDNADIFLQEDL